MTVYGTSRPHWFKENAMARLGQSRDSWPSIEIDATSRPRGVNKNSKAFKKQKQKPNHNENEKQNENKNEN